LVCRILFIISRY